MTFYNPTCFGKMKEIVSFSSGEKRFLAQKMLIYYSIFCHLHTCIINYAFFSNYVFYKIFTYCLIFCHLYFFSD